MTSSLFKDLNKAQVEAVTCVDNPSLILAGAGSGKTRVLTHKVRHLIDVHGVSPQSIVMITFTNKAASEMKKRINTALGFVGTFHSFCLQVLKKHASGAGLTRDFVIYDEGDQYSIAKDLIQNASLEKVYTPSSLISKISMAKNQLIGPGEYAEIFTSHKSQQVGELYTKYQSILNKNNAVDFDDLIMKTAHLFSVRDDILARYHTQFHYILVDEFQDTNYAQYLLVKQLVKKEKKLTVVGDFSQSIYSWRGAQIHNLEKIQEDFPSICLFRLEQNYRSTQSILNFSYEIISQNNTHPVLQLYTENPQGDEVSTHELATEQDEAFFIADMLEEIEREKTIPSSSIALLYRTNAQSRVIEEVFLHRSIPYILVGGTRFYERKEVKDILSYLRLILNPQDTVSLKRVLKIGKRRYQHFNTIQQNLNGQKHTIPTIELMEEIFKSTGYLELYDKNDPEEYGRLENVKELRSVALSFPHLDEFLSQIALVESEYSENEKRRKGKEGVYMMTLHQAKGLEFEYVFITGVEDGILPHSRSIFDSEALEEERRLFYVGITRAQKKLFITHAQKRFMFGARSYSQRSRFLPSDKVISFPFTDSA